MNAAVRARVPAWAPPVACAALALALVALLRLPAATLGPRGARVLPAAVLFDFTVTVPLVWWWLAVRGRGASRRSLALVAGACVTLAHAVVGDRTPFTRMALAAIGGALELFVALRIALAVRAARRTSGNDFVDRVETATAELFGRGAVARAVGGELALLGYAIAGPWRRPAGGAGRFGHQDELGRGAIVAGLLMVIACEAGAVHAGLVHAHPRWAWTLTLSSVWGALWLWGDWQSLRLRRSTLADGVLELRVGLRARASVPVARIAAVRTGREAADARGAGVLLAYPKPAEATVLLELDGPLDAFGFYGWPRRVTRIALAPDERARFLAELDAARQ